MWTYKRAGWNQFQWKKKEEKVKAQLWVDWTWGPGRWEEDRRKKFQAAVLTSGTSSCICAWQKGKKKKAEGYWDYCNATLILSKVKWHEQDSHAGADFKIKTKTFFSLVWQNHSITALFYGFRIIYFLLAKFCQLFLFIWKCFSLVTIFNPSLRLNPAWVPTQQNRLRLERWSRGFFPRSRVCVCVCVHMISFLYLFWNRGQCQGCFQSHVIYWSSHCKSM